MYHFTLGGMECRCDTADELRAICEDRSAKVVATSPKETTDPILDPSTAREAPRATATARATGGPATDRELSRKEMLMKLPYVKEGLSWKVVHRIAKQLGRTDTRQLRSDLHERKSMGR